MSNKKQLSKQKALSVIIAFMTLFFMTSCDTTPEESNVSEYSQVETTSGDKETTDTPESMSFDESTSSTASVESTTASVQTNSSESTVESTVESYGRPFQKSIPQSYYSPDTFVPGTTYYNGIHVPNDAYKMPMIVPENMIDPNPADPNARKIRSRLDIRVAAFESFCHGEKTSAYQKYIVLHDTEEELDPSGVVGLWLGRNDQEVATHFVVGRDGTIVQCVPLDQIAYHAGTGDAGSDNKFSVYDDPRNEYYSGGIDIGMNCWSVGIELCHIGTEEMGYPVETQYSEEMLESLDGLIEYIDEYYGFECEIICHKDWRSTNNDTSAEFEHYLDNYKKYRSHLPKAVVQQ